jgi:hypothetical protein
MKLYTEEQVKDMFSGVMEEYQIDEFLKENYIPIELPSDEEIDERSYLDKDNDKLIVNAAEIARFRDGAKWLRDKLLNQNK